MKQATGVWSAALLVLAAAPAWGQEEKKQEEKDVTLEGTLSKETAKRKAKDGTERDVTTYWLTTKDGAKLQLVAPKGKDGKDIIAKWNGVCGKAVCVKGKGLEGVKKAKGGDVKQVTFSKVEAVAEVAPPKEEKKDDPK
jgi:hypothetical protein